MPYEAPPELAAMSLAEIAQAVAERKLPPIDQWSPAEEIDSKMRIAADGTWFHDGGAIRRPAMVRAFSSLLKRDDDGQHWLMTPQCRQSIEVDDAAFIATDVQQADDALAFRLNTDEIVIAGPDNPLIPRGNAEMPAIYVQVRNGCEARLNRSTWLQLAQLALASSDDPIVTSKGATFSLVPA